MNNIQSTPFLDTQPLIQKLQLNDEFTSSPPAHAPHRTPDVAHLFTILADQSPDAVLRIAKDGTLLYSNSLAAEWFDLPFGEHLGVNIHDNCHRLGYDNFWKDILEQTCSTGVSHFGCAKVVINNRTRIYEVRASSETDGITHFDAIIATIRDATERHIHEHSIGEAHKRLLYHLNNSPLAIIEWDNSRNLLSWNDMAESLFGWTQHEAQQRFDNPLPLIHPEDRTLFCEYYENLRCGRETSSHLRCRIQSRFDVVSWCDWYLSSLRDDSANSLSILCQINDVSESVLSTRKLQTLNGALEEKFNLSINQLNTAGDGLAFANLCKQQLERDMIIICEREHRRIGHDLHDSICQELAGLRFAISALANNPETNATLRRRLIQLEDAALRAMRETRLLARGLAPFVLEDGDLYTSLRELAQNTSTLHAIQCRLHWRGRKLLFSQETALNLFRIAQEALHNAIRHGKATAIDIRISINAKTVRLKVDDNGSGIPVTPTLSANGHGMGQKIIQYRAAILNAHVSISPRPNTQGARLLCSLPIPKPLSPCNALQKPSIKSKSLKTTR